MSVFALTACSSGRENQGKQEAKLKVALLTPGPISDQSWNGGAYAGLERIRDSLGASDRDDVDALHTQVAAEPPGRGLQRDPVGDAFHEDHGHALTLA